jgi:hypothetical protein
MTWAAHNPRIRRGQRTSEFYTGGEGSGAIVLFGQLQRILNLFIVG